MAEEQKNSNPDPNASGEGGGPAPGQNPPSAGASQDSSNSNSQGEQNPPAPEATKGGSEAKPSNAKKQATETQASVAISPAKPPVSYDSLRSNDKVAVQLCPLQEVREGENKVIKAEQIVAWTKAHIERLKADNKERFDKPNKNGEVFLPELNRRIKVLGVPTFEEQESEAGGTIEVLTGWTPFA